VERIEEQEHQNRTAKNREQDSKNREAKNRTARTGLPRLDQQNITAWTGQPE
jgi:hypothetical protein